MDKSESHPANSDIAGEDPELEQLVAYLDGELEPNEMRSVEQRLGADPAFRSRLHELEKAWDILDSLPRHQAPAEFAQSTVEMIAVSAENELATAQQQARRSQLWTWMLGTAGVLLGGLIGYGLMDRYNGREDRQLIEDLPVVENLEMYRVADSLEFLRELEESGLFPEAEGVDDEPIDESSE